VIKLTPKGVPKQMPSSKVPKRLLSALKLGPAINCHTLVISEGKSAILCQSLEDVAAKIEQLKAIVKVGGLDPQIEAASGAIRSRFKKSK
jgi:hypothetical protein